VLLFHPQQIVLFLSLKLLTKRVVFLFQNTVYQMHPAVAKAESDEAGPGQRLHYCNVHGNVNVNGDRDRERKPESDDWNGAPLKPAPQQHTNPGRRDPSRSRLLLEYAPQNGGGSSSSNGAGDLRPPMLGTAFPALNHVDPAVSVASQTSLQPFASPLPLPSILCDLLRAFIHTNSADAGTEIDATFPL
jgi:hypothetical protein